MQLLFRYFPLTFLLILSHLPLTAQTDLSVEWIMRNPKWMGHFPGSPSWGEDSRHIYFNWNNDNAPADSLHRYTISNGKIEKLSLAEKIAHRPSNGTYNDDRSQMLYQKDGDIFLLDLKKMRSQAIVQSSLRETNPSFLTDGSISYVSGNNVFLWSPTNGASSQVTNFISGSGRGKGEKSVKGQKKWVQAEELGMMEVLTKRRKDREARAEAYAKEHPLHPQAHYLKGKRIGNLSLSPKGDQLLFRLTQPARSDRTEVPNYIDESGYADMLNARPKVGSKQDRYELGVYSISGDSVHIVSIDHLPGIDKMPTFYEDYPKLDKPEKREVVFLAPIWSEEGNKALIVIKAADFKDRWITVWDTDLDSLLVLDHQHDEAWIDGPGISRWLAARGALGWVNAETVWFQSEESGYSHLYSQKIGAEKKALTNGKYEVFNPQLSQDKKHWYFTSSQAHPGLRHFYKMPVGGGKAIQITSMPGNNQVSLSPDEKWLAIRYSEANQPWELYLMPNEAGAMAKQLTVSQSSEFKSYAWRKPEFVTFKASDGQKVHARLYPAKTQTDQGKAVIFVHGAGYLQNAHQWWSNYFREYMFHNLLADQGYTVLDMDFRASAGYGRDWRTAVYRHMGSKDLSDQVDGAKFLVEKHGIDPNRIGIYGGSYGGFITLMAMFTSPGTFKAGAALRPVTDWAHYNHQYTASMLNQPQDDSLAYVRSSPIYHADGLQDHLLICHGMIDTNVHFQDVVRLSQRLIELGKNNWEVALYPMEGHGFREPSSWTDEYKRILKLFEERL
ncbi:MAG: prolyl oligopeptidase family serine peptidase [Bacteroidota bacterium]